MALRRRFVGRSRVLALVGLLLVGALLVWPTGLAGRTTSGVRDGELVRLELVGSAAGAARLVTDAHQVVVALPFHLLLTALVTAVLVTGAWLLVPLFRLRALRTSTRVAMVLAAVPGALDLVEDGLLALGLHFGQDLWFRGAAVFAVTKYVLLLGLVALAVVAAAAGCVTPRWLYEVLDAEALVEPAQESETAPTDDPPAPTRGVALSGGGVRAATLALGSLQELDRDPHLAWDGSAVTAVSGGAYMAGAWLLGRDRLVGDPQAWAVDDGGRRLGPEERHLVDNLGYLTATWPRGRPDEPGTPRGVTASSRETVPARARNLPSVWVTIAIGLIVNTIVLGAVVVVLVTPLALGLRFLVGIDGCEGRTGPALPLCLAAQPRIWAAPLGWLVASGFLAFAWVVLAKTGARSQPGTTLVARVATLGSLALSGILALLLLGLPLLIALADALSWGLVLAALGAAVGVVGSVVRIMRRFVAVLAPKIGGVAFVLLLLVGVGALGSFVWTRGRAVATVTPTEVANGLSPGRVALFVGALVVVVAVWGLASPELWSLNAFYRGKLRSAYALHRVDGEAVAYVNDHDAGGDGLVEEPELDTLVRSDVRICASATATTKSIRTHYGIPALSFTFDSDRVATFVPENDQGDFTTYACTTEAFARAYPGSGRATTRRITTMFAVALAGAAVSPAMGRYRIGPTSALLTFANIRLGAWVPNPRYVPAADAARRFPFVRLGYLLKEFLSVHDPTDPFVYVTDGGHWDNSGLVELLRTRMPDEVVMVDADNASARSLNQLSQAIDLARLECDVDVFVDLEPLRGFAEQAGGPVFAERAVTLGLLRQQSRWGLLWYTRSVLTRDTPTPLLAHREAFADFPSTSTLDQFFDTSTYVAYRDLGRFHAAEVRQARARLVAAFGSLTPGADVQAVLRSPATGWVGPTLADLLQQLPVADADVLVAQVGVVLARDEGASPPSAAP